MKKPMKALNGLIIFLLLVCINLIILTSKNITAQNNETKEALAEISQQLKKLEIKETIWLIPNDVSCGEFWTAEQLRSISEEYELTASDN
jgi:hypothetical protein